MKHILLLTVVICLSVQMGDSARGGSPTSSSRAKTRTFDLQQMLAVANGNMDKDYFDQALNRIMIPRVPGTASHLLVHDFIVDTFRDLGWNIDEDAFMANTPHGAKPFRNLIATVNSRSCKRLVLACHYDSKYFKKGEFVAATDSAVPCAMLIAIAKSLDAALKDKSMRNPLATSLQLMFFDGEEAFETWSSTDSLYGSRHLADKLNKTPIVDPECKSGDMISELDRIELLVLLDLLGAASPKFFSFFPETDQQYARLMNIEQTLASSQQLTGISASKKYFQNRRSFNYIEDDHVPFFQRGVKILHVIPSPFPDVWHKLSDNASALHQPTIQDLLKIFKVFVAEYLNLNTQLI